MSAHTYTEDQLVEQPAIGLFAELGWTTGSAFEDTFGAIGASLPLRQSRRDKIEGKNG